MSGYDYPPATVPMPVSESEHERIVRDLADEIDMLRQQLDEARAVVEGRDAHGHGPWAAYVDSDVICTRCRQVERLRRSVTMPGRNEWAVLHPGDGSCNVPRVRKAVSR